LVTIIVTTTKEKKMKEKNGVGGGGVRNIIPLLYFNGVFRASPKPWRSNKI